MMSAIHEYVGVALVVAGLIFMLLGSIGLVRLPDFFTRTHAATKVDTVGIMIVLLGISVIEGVSVNSGKIIMAAIFLALTNPVSAHALGRAALHLGIRPWRRRDDEQESGGR